MTDPLTSPPNDSSVDQEATGAWSRPDNRFVPVRACDLTRAVIDDASQFGCSADSIREFAMALQEVIDRETGSFERRLTDGYARFNPDCDTLPASDAAPVCGADYETLQQQLAYLLDKANYEELSDVQIAQAVMQARSRNLRVRVHADRIEFLIVWVRGRGDTAQTKRTVWRPWRLEVTHVPVFKRMVVVARLKGEPHVIIKLFKDIPETDVEALLPHAEVTMTILDRLKLWGSGAGTLGLTATKIFKIAIGLAALWKLVWILLVGLATLAVRAALGYRNARINRDWQRTRHLYFQNLGNNASALQLLVATVKQEEFKEALLGYLFSIEQSSDDGDSVLRTEIERYLRERFDVKVDFDVDDAEAKLTALGLWRSRESGQVLAMDEAISWLRSLWREHGERGRILERR